MLVANALSAIRRRINDEYDTGYSQEVLINYLNDAIKYLAAALIARNDPILCKQITVASNGGADVPQNFVRFAGGYPIKRMGDKFYTVNTDINVVAKYFYIPEDLTAATDSLPFTANNTYDTAIVNMACLYALNQHEFNIQQDNALNTQLDEIVSKALGVIE